MGKILSFEDLDCWIKARELTNQIYTNFSSIRNFGFKDQIERSSLSIMNNIAEGFGRWSAKDRIHFLNIAYGSALETKSMLYIALDQKLTTQEKFDEMMQCNLDVTHLILGFLRHLHSFKRHEVDPKLNNGI